MKSEKKIKLIGETDRPIGRGGKGEREGQREVECEKSVRVWINKFSAGERCLLRVGAA